MKYLIDFHHGVTEEQIDAYLDQYGYTFLQEWDNFERIVLVESDVEPVKTDLIEYVVRDDHLEIRPQMAETIYFDKNHCSLNVPGLPTTTFSTSDEKDWWKNYILPEPDFDNPTVSISRKGQNISVYVMDSGIDANHPDFQGVNITNLYTVTENDFTDSAGHGTAVSSIISGRTCGITDAHIKVVKIFRPDRGTYQSEFISALDAILSDFEQNSYAVVNCSWSIPKNQYIEDKLRQMIFQGLYVVAASGNSGSPIEDVTPASMDEVVTVGSFNSDLLPSQFSDYTGGSSISYTENDVNHGELDGWAPGERIYIASVNGLSIDGSNFGFAAGTSMSCAIASAVAVYNLTNFLDDDGKRLKGYENYLLPFHRYFLFQRPNLLDLSDPKYQNSKNYLVTLLNQFMYESAGQSSEMTLHAYTGKGDQNIASMFNIFTTSEVTVVDPLPEFCWINKDGFLWANPPENSNINAETNENYLIYKFSLSVTDKDNQTIVKKISLYVLPQDINPEDYPGDHEINVTLLTACSWVTTPSCPGLGPAESGCSDSCPGFAPFCCQFQFKGDRCWCGMFG
jgi:hypothetical protein